MRNTDKLNLRITAAFRTPQDNTYYVVDNQAGFGYVMYHGNRYYTGTQLRPEIKSWLFDRKNESTFALSGNKNQLLTRVKFDNEMLVEVFYSSLHHVDER